MFLENQSCFQIVEFNIINNLKQLKTTNKLSILAIQGEMLDFITIGLWFIFGR